MGNILRTLLQERRLVRFMDCEGKKKKMAKVGNLQDLEETAKKRLDINPKDRISVVESTTGHEIEDNETFLSLTEDTLCTILNVSEGESWKRPPDVPMSVSHPPFALSPNHQVMRVASGSLTINNIVSIQAQSAQVGDNNQILRTGGSVEPTEDEDIGSGVAT